MNKYFFFRVSPLVFEEAPERKQKRTFMKKIYSFILFPFSFFSCLSQSVYDKANYYFSAPNDITVATGICKTFDGNLICRVEAKFGYPFSIIKINPAGNMLWINNFYDTLSSIYDIGNIIQLKDSSFVFVEGIQMIPSMPNQKPFVIKTDKNGNFLSANYYAINPSLTAVDVAGVNTIIPTADGGFLLGGYENTIDHLLLTKVNSLGNVQWSKDYPATLYPRTVVETNDGGYMIYGYRNTLPKLMKVDSIGVPVFQKSYLIGGSCSTCMTYYNMAAISGGYLLSGIDNNPTGGRSPFFIKTDTMGNVLWYKIYNAFQNTQDMLALCLGVNNNNEYIVMGQKPDALNVMHLFYFLTDSSGNMKWYRQRQQGAPHTPYVLTPYGNDFFYGGDNYDGGSIAHLDSAMNGICDYISLNPESDTATVNQIGNVPVYSTRAITLVPLPYSFTFDSVLYDTILCPSPLVVSVTENNKEKNDILIYPNPSSGKFQVTSSKSQVTSMDVYNLYGEKTVAVAGSSGSEIQIDISNQPDGIYFVRVNTEKGVTGKKIILAR